MANLNSECSSGRDDFLTDFSLESIHVPVNHVPMIKIDCEVDDTKLVFVKRAHIPPSFRDGLFQFYSADSQTAL